MSDVVQPYAPRLMRCLIDYGRMAVQVFLVVAGFLTAASLGSKQLFRAGELPSLLLRRYLRRRKVGIKAF